MTKIKKQKQRKSYRHSINRKRKRNKMTSTGKITCQEIKEAWEDNKSVNANLLSMGLSSDPNKTISISSKNNQTEKRKRHKAYVAEALEQDAKAPRERQFQLPNSQVERITYLMDTYGADYKAMARDKKNYYQETWRQIRAKIRQFKGVPEQFSKYLQDRNLNVKDLPKENLEEDSD